MTDTDDVFGASEVSIDDLRRDDGTIDARMLQHGNSENIENSYTVTAATCQNWRLRLLDGERAGAVANADGVAIDTVTSHARADCNHDVEAPALTYSDSTSRWSAADPAEGLAFRYVVRSEWASAAHISPECGHLDSATAPVECVRAEETDRRDCVCVHSARMPGLDDERAGFNVDDFVAMFLMTLIAVMTISLLIAGVIGP